MYNSSQPDVTQSAIQSKPPNLLGQTGGDKQVAGPAQWGEGMAAPPPLPHSQLPGGDATRAKHSLQMATWSADCCCG